MRSSRFDIETRRNQILKNLHDIGTVNVQILAKEIGVSSLTIRRDLEALEKMEKIRRYYGGASLDKNTAKKEENNISGGYLPPRQNADLPIRHTQATIAIARYAASLVSDDDTIFINTSLTAIAVIPFITAKNVTVITNNARALDAEIPKEVNLIFTGGEMRFPKGAMVGDFALNNLSTVTAGKCFLGCNGITANEGVTTEIMQEASINHKMLTRVMGPRYILADNTKVGQRLSFIYGTLKEVTMLITDTETPSELVEELRQQIEVYQVAAIGG